MGKIQSSDWSNKRYSPQNFVMSHHELVALDKELEVYKYKKFSKYWDRELDLVDTEKWIEARGGTKNGAVVIRKHTPAVYDTQGKMVEAQDCDPILFETLNEMLRQWLDWRGKKEYAKKKELEHLGSLADKLTVECG